MAAKKKRVLKTRKKAAARSTGAASPVNETSSRLRRSDDEKLQIVRQVIASANRGEEIKKLGIYPNQFYDWKKKYLDAAGASSASGRGRKPGRRPNGGAGSAADDAKAFIHGKAALLDRLRAQRAEFDTLIAQLEQ